MSAGAESLPDTRRSGSCGNPAEGDHPCNPVPNDNGTATCSECGWTGGFPEGDRAILIEAIRRADNDSRLLDGRHYDPRWQERANHALHRLLQADQDIEDEREMTTQAIRDLRILEKDWPRMVEETNFDGEPLIVELLRSVIDDLGGNL